MSNNLLRECWAKSRGVNLCQLGCEMSGIKRLPDIRQDAAHDCGHAAIRCVIQHHSPGAVVVIDLSTPQFGLDPAVMESIFRAKLAWNTSCGERTLDELAYYCGDGRPVICPTQHKGAGHYVVVHAVTSKRVYYHCPIVGATWAKIPDWLAAWTDGGRWGEFWRFGLVAWPRAKNNEGIR